jgi:hypothetical protein
VEGDDYYDGWSPSLHVNDACWNFWSISTTFYQVFRFKVKLLQ